MSLQIRILTPGGIFCNESADELILTTSTGQIGVLKGHAPLITALDIGSILIRRESSWTVMALIGGFALVQDEKVTILVNEAVDASLVNKSEAESALREATNRVQQVISEKEKVEATLAYKRARARYQIVTTQKLFYIVSKLLHRTNVVFK